MAQAILDWMGEYVMPWFMIVLLCLAIFATAMVVVLLIQFALLPDAEPPTSGVVVRKIHEEAHTTTSIVPMGKVMVSRPRHHPERWDLVVRLDGAEKGEQLVSVS